MINYEIFSLKITKKSCHKGLKYCKFMRGRNKAEQVMRKIILKGNMKTTYIEHKLKNAGTSVLIHPKIVEKRNR